MVGTLRDPVKLPCGLVLPNRFVKAAMAEGAGDANHEPTEQLLNIYSTWGRGGWGGLITGNFQADVRYLGGPSEVVGPSTAEPAVPESWKKMAARAQEGGAPTFVQICHPGRQSPAFMGTKSFFEKSPSASAIPLNLGSGVMAWAVSKLLFGTPRALTVSEIGDITNLYVNTAKWATDAGFAGIELHGAHGYLITQFLSSKTNIRTDEYGGSPEKRTKFLVDIIRAIRSKVPSSFCIGVKLNSADTQESGELQETLDQIQFILDAGIDFLEISGGSYENPRMALGNDTKQDSATNVPAPPKPAQSHTAEREAFFLQYAQLIRARYPNVVLMVTGGFRSRKAMSEAIESGACDIVGLGRPAVLYPDLPHRMLDEDADENMKVEVPKIQRSKVASWLLPKKLVGAGADSMYYQAKLLAIASG